MLLFLSLFSLALAIAGATAFVIFWPLMLVHVRDRHPRLQSELGANAFARPSAWAWLLRGDFKRADDANLNGLATPARVSLMTIIAGTAEAVADRNIDCRAKLQITSADVGDTGSNPIHGPAPSWRPGDNPNWCSGSRWQSPFPPSATQAHRHCCPASPISG